MKMSLTSLPGLDFGLSGFYQPLAMDTTISAGESTQEEGLPAERKMKKGRGPLRGSCELAFSIRIGRVRRDDMADHPEFRPCLSTDPV